jgi:hypothetical protein
MTSVDPQGRPMSRWTVSPLGFCVYLLPEGAPRSRRALRHLPYELLSGTFLY